MSIEQILEREQYWINLLNPIYNILKIAGNSVLRVGFKHTHLSPMGAWEETKELIRQKALGRKHLEDTKLLMSSKRGSSVKAPLFSFQEKRGALMKNVIKRGLN